MKALNVRTVLSEKIEHKLENCESFLALDAYERFRFRMRNLVCYGGFGLKNSARSCS
jgi:hypothetical protein